MWSQSVRWSILALVASVALWQVSGRVPPSAAAPPAQSGATPTYDLPKITPAVYNGDVRNLPFVAPKPRAQRVLGRLPSPKLPSPGEAALPSPNIALAAMPSPILNFAGLSHNDIVVGGQAGAGYPPDINGDVGPNHYVLAVNSAYAIYNKTGTQLAAFTEDSFWSGTPATPCNGNSQGDPIVLYDAQEDRWILTHFAFAVDASFNPLAPFYQCIAVSQTSDPVSGGWYFYPIRMALARV